MVGKPIVRFRGVTKRFPGVVALRDVNLDVRQGSCHGLVGENGAGKSTLGKILAGIHTFDRGQISIEEEPVRFTSPREARNAGIGMVHQELAFCENLSVAENLCLGDLPARGLFLSRQRMFEQAHQWLETIQAPLDVRKQVGDLPISQQQLVQIAGAVGRGARILIFDEPTSSLSQVESQHLFDLIQRLQEQGVTSLYISHRLEEIFHLCDTVTVLRDGQVAATQSVSDLDESSLVHMMIGRPFETYFPMHLEAEPCEELLRVEDLSSPGKFEGISFTLRAGEILGLAGLIGAGRTEIAEAIFGLDPMVMGRVYMQGESVALRHPSDVMARGIGLVPEDRKRHGLVLSMSAMENMTLPILERLARSGWIRRQEERTLARRFFGLMHIKGHGMDALTASLSGGNQQKLVLARWLAAHCRILLLDEPTRGVDVGTKAEIHGFIDQLAREGNGILLISSELPEVINLSTRILVFRRGRVVGELAHEEADQATVMRFMAGIAA